MRKVFALVTVVLFAVVFYSYLREGQSRKIKTEMLRLVDDFSLSPPQTLAAKNTIEQTHDEVFRAALDLSRDRGRKFDIKQYQDEMFRRMIEQAGASGDRDLAEKLAAQKDHHEIVVAEQ